MATIRKLRGRWQAMVRRKGLQPRAKSFDVKTDAEKWARSLEAELDRCGNLPDTRVAEKMTVRELLERYVAEITPAKRSASSERYRIRGMLTRSICFRTLAMLTPAEVAKYRDERLGQVAPATVIRELNTLGHAIDIGRKEWGIHLAQNPCRMIRRPVPPRGRNRRLQDGEEQRLLEAADAGRNPFMRAMIILAVETAMRQGEILALTWDNVDLDRRVAHLPVTKNGDSRDIPLSQRATETLRSLASERSGDRVMETTKSAVEQAWGHLRNRAGIPDLRYHDLRHEAVTRLLERGFNVIETATISGHKELRMLQRYSHLKAVDLVERLG